MELYNELRSADDFIIKWDGIPAERMVGGTQDAEVLSGRAAGKTQSEPQPSMGHFGALSG